MVFRVMLPSNFRAAYASIFYSVAGSNRFPLMLATTYGNDVSLLTVDVAIIYIDI
jgi:hypothetical protein